MTLCRICSGLLLLYKCRQPHALTRLRGYTVDGTNRPAYVVQTRNHYLEMRVILEIPNQN